MVIMVESLHGINIAVIDIKVFGVIDILCSLKKQPFLLWELKFVLMG